MPLIGITAGSSEFERVLTLRAGLDVCMAPTFGVSELVATRDRVEKALAEAFLQDLRSRGNGMVFDGGTPGHRSLEATIDDQPTGAKVLAASEQELENKLDGIFQGPFSQIPGLTRERISAVRPDDWPVSNMFSTWISR